MNVRDVDNQIRMSIIENHRREIQDGSLIVNNVIVVSHRRSGTHFLIDAMMNNFACYSDIKYLTLERLLPWPKTQQIDLPTYRETVESNQVNVFKTHIVSDFASLLLPKEIEDYLYQTLGSNKKLYIYRDGRDVMVSLYNYMKGFDQETASGSFSEFLRGNNIFDRGEYNKINRIRYWKRHIDGWKPSELDKTIMFVSYEELFLDFENTLEVIARFLEQPLNDPIVDVRMRREKKQSKFERKIMKVLQLMRLAKIKRTSIGFHTGGIGKYESYFLDSDLRFYDQQISAEKDTTNPSTLQ